MRITMIFFIFMISGIVWNEILSELFVNLAAGWFALILIEANIDFEMSLRYLTFRMILGIFSLLVAKYLRDKVKTYELYRNSK